MQRRRKIDKSLDAAIAVEAAILGNQGKQIASLELVGVAPANHCRMGRRTRSESGKSLSLSQLIGRLPLLPHPGEFFFLLGAQSPTRNSNGFVFPRNPSHKEESEGQ